MISILKIVVGNLLITFSYAFITVPNEIVNGGVTSFSMILSSVTDLGISFYTNCITILLLVLCLFFLGKSYLAKSIVSSACYMLFFSFFNGIGFGFASIPMIISVLIAGLLVGIGYFLCLSAESSTVGFDVIALILHTKNNKIKVSKAMRYINLFVILLGLFSYGLLAVIYGVIFTYIQTTVVHLLLEDNVIENVKNFYYRVKEGF
ncbi:YitT family protein [Holdemanella biformis]|uniref:YitT family protein n=1 Tax=Holdemanella biformis TaxID=1735 RepID=UPI002E780568|nr:YitT family protein [Holdemanella biformis]MEE0667559.1 YitT family protein [Holdemanella biformis]